MGNRFGETLPPVTDEDARGQRGWNTRSYDLRLLERMLNYQIEKHTTGCVIASGGGFGGGYGGGQQTSAHVLHMNTTADAARAYVVPGVEGSSSMCPANTYARIVYLPDGGLVPGGLVELTDWTEIDPTPCARTPLTLKVTEIPASATVWFQFSVPDVMPPVEFQGSGHLEIVRTGIPPA